MLDCDQSMSSGAVTERVSNSVRKKQICPAGTLIDCIMQQQAPQLQLQQNLQNDYQTATKAYVLPRTPNEMITFDGNLSDCRVITALCGKPLSLFNDLSVSYVSMLTYSDLNNLVLNFLILEGYESAAKKFAAEANLTPKIPTDTIHERVEIRSAIVRGDVTRSIMLINNLNPEVSSSKRSIRCI